MKISISVEGTFGLNWPRWQRLIQEIEALGFAGIFLSDHFGVRDSGDPYTIELIVALTYLADHTDRVHFGSMVAPLSFRDPVFLARQAGAIDDLSGGRMILGLGAGWNEPEHEMFGYDLGDIPERMDRFGEGLAVITGLLRNDSRQTLDGDFFQLNDAFLARPEPVATPRILIGGSGPKRILPLVARYADIWNGQLLTPEEYRERSALLNKLIIEAGRRPEDVARTMTLPLICGRSEADFERSAGFLRTMDPSWETMTIMEVLDALGSAFVSLTVGTPEQVVERLRAYAAAGVTEMMLQWGALDDIEGLRTIAEKVMPLVD